MQANSYFIAQDDPPLAHTRNRNLATDTTGTEHDGLLSHDPNIRDYENFPLRSDRSSENDGGRQWVDGQQTPSSISTLSSSSPSLEGTGAQVLDCATSFFPPVPAGAALPPLPRPVLIPRLGPKAPTPFARAWPPELASHAVQIDDFMAFVDNLNIIMIPHPAVRALKLTALAVGAVPYHVAAGASAGIDAVATVLSVAMAKRRTKEYFQKVNESYFHPRKLHAEIIDAKRVKELLKLDKDDPLIAPLSTDNLDQTVQDRCLKYMAQYTCELSFDVPNPSPQTTRLAKMSAWEVDRNIQRADKHAIVRRERALKRHAEGKSLKEPKREKKRAKTLDWILVQNLDEWEAGIGEQPAEKPEKSTKREERLVKKEERLVKKEERLVKKEEKLAKKEDKSIRKEEKKSAKKEERLVKEEEKLAKKDAKKNKSSR